MIKKVNAKSFKGKYLNRLPDSFEWQKTPVQIYPLETLSSHLRIPTPLLKADYHFFIYLKDGQFEQQIGIEKYTVIGPSIMHVPEGELFSINSLNDSLLGYFILIEAKVIISLSSKIDYNKIISIGAVSKLDVGHNKWFIEGFDLLYNELSSAQPSRDVTSGILQAIIFKLINYGVGNTTLSRQHQIANNFKQLVNSSYVQQKKVEYYATQLNISKNYLNRCVKSAFGKSCKQIIQETTIRKSQVLMLNSLKDISEISFDVGIDDPSYFSRLFKQITNQTPSSFKKQIMHDLS